MDYSKLEAWRQADMALKAAKELELTLRKELFDATFNTDKEGVHKAPLNEGWTLEASLPYNRTLDQELVPDTLRMLYTMNASAALIKTKYELSVAEYRKLDAQQKKTVDAILTTKPGTPSIKLVPPKSA